MAQGMGTQNVFYVGNRGKMQTIIEHLLHFLCFFKVMETAPYPSPRCVQSWFSDKAMAS